MTRQSPSALITDQGQRVLLRIKGRLHELSQDELRAVLGLPPGAPGLGITVNRNRFIFEFVSHPQAVALSADQLLRRLGKLVTSKS